MTVRVDRAKQSLLEFARRTKIDVERLDAGHAVRLMLGFYTDEPAEAVCADDGDMLLYQWGLHQFMPAPAPSFQFDLTRQLIVGDGEDEEIWQLSLTLHYAPGDELIALASGNRWCRTRADVDEMREFIARSPAFAAVSRLVAASTAMKFGPVG